MKRSRWSKFCEEVRHAYWKIVPYGWRPSSIWYAFTCLVWYKYNVIKPRYVGRTHWIDRCELLPHAMFEILSQFIEKECSPGHIDWGSTGHVIVVDGKEVNVRDEMQSLYDWWHWEYNKHRIYEDETIHKELAEHSPTSFQKPINAVGEEVPEDEADYFEFCPMYKTPEDKAATDALYKDMWELEKKWDTELNERMHRLVNLLPYLWT